MRTGSKLIVANVLTPAQQGYERARNEAGSGENTYPTRQPTEPDDDPAPLSEWEGRQGAVKPASRYQQPWAYQDVGQGLSAGRTRLHAKNKGPLEY